MKRILTTLGLIFACLCSAWAQQRTITGTVTAHDEPAGLPGVSVYGKNTKIGTVTDINGKYALQLPDTVGTLVFSFVGYMTQEVAIGNQTQVDVVLELNMEMLDEVVVIGYGEQQKRVATGSIAQVSAERLSGYQVASVSSALDGQTSGLLVSGSSGQPGSQASIFIRGVSTNGDNSPLYIVDGLQVEEIGNINPNDIASIDVLKDAASAAIYGARAANGVVIITTKKGGEDGAGTLSYEAFTSVSTAWRIPDMLDANDYVALTREKFANAGQSLNNFPLTGEGLATTNWMQELFEPATVQSHRLTASAANTFLSLEYWNQDGVVGGDKSYYRRYAARLNSTKPINDYFTLGENLYISRVENPRIPDNNAFGSVLADAFAYDPLTPIQDDAAQYGFAQSPWVRKEYVNPFSRLFITNNSGHADQIVGNAYIEFKPMPGLRFRSDFGVDMVWYNYRSFTPNYEFHPAFQNVSNDVVQGYGFRQALQFENYVNYKKEFGQHSLDLVAGTTYRTRQAEFASAVTSDIPYDVQFDPQWQYVNPGQDTTEIAGGGADVDYALISYYARAIYNYKGRYLLSATIRRDGSSNFGANNRWGIFPSVSLGWVISDEDFFQLSGVNFLKLRASYGVNGNDRITPLSFASRIVNAFTYPFGLDHSVQTGAAPATPANPGVKWEESVQFDLGLEARFLGDRLTAEVDVYRKTTKDLLMDQIIPGYLGATGNPISNLGEIQNTGIEAAISYRMTLGELRLNTTLNYTHFKNKVTNVAGDAGVIQGWSWPVRNTPITRMTEGYPLAHFIGYKTLGIFQSQAEVFSHLNANGDLLQPKAAPGDLIFADVNGDGVINSQDMTDIGSPWPDHILGLTLQAQYKGFDMSVVFSTQIGQDVYRTYERSDVTFTNYQTFWKDRWTETNPSSTMPRLIATDPNGNQNPSDFYVEDASFLRLRNFQLGYNVPAELLQKVKIRALRVYVSGNNLFTVTGYRGFDPEIGTNPDWVLDTGIDKGFYPSNRTIGAGLRITL